MFETAERRRVNAGKPRLGFSFRNFRKSVMVGAVCEKDASDLPVGTVLPLFTG